MQIHVHRGSEALGAFTPDETTRYLADGRLLETDLAWCEGHEDKIPVAELLEVLPGQTGETFDEERTVSPDLAGEKSRREGEVHPVFGGGRYKREKLLGQGGMGQVWLAFDKQLERLVAVKMVSKKYVANQKALNALKAEVQRSLELTHPNIVRTYDLNETPGEDPFISMEYVEGEEFSKRREKQPEKRFTWREIEPHILKLCEALEYAHGQGMVHRDLKPQNVMLAADNELKLADFGIAAPVKDKPEEDTSMGEETRSGTPTYWSPQQAQGGAPAPTDDVYSLGVMLYELLVGEPPFKGPNEPAITRQHVRKPPPNPQEKLKELGSTARIPVYVRDLILICMAKDPTQRPQGMVEVRAWIKAKGHPVMRQQKRTALKSLALGILALAIGSLAIWGWSQLLKLREVQIGQAGPIEEPHPDVHAPGTKLWEFVAGGRITSSPAIGFGGAIYFGADDSKVYALNGRTGAELWEFPTNKRVEASPAVGADGTVYVASDDGKVYALDGRTGEKRWEFATGGGIRASPTIAANGVVYVGSFDNKLYALNSRTGVMIWAFSTKAVVASSVAIGADSTIYFGSEHRDNNLYALNSNGTLKWNYTTGSAVVSSPAIGADGTVYFGSHDRNLYALDGKTGAKKWAFTTGDRVKCSPAIGTDGTVYFGSYDGRIYALNPGGTMKWEFNAGGAVHSSPAIGADGTVYIGSKANKLYALNGLTGKKKWEFTTGDQVYSSPVIGADGTVYVGSLDNKLYAIRSRSRGLAKSPWPIFGSGLRRTGSQVLSFQNKGAPQE